MVKDTIIINHLKKTDYQGYTHLMNQFRSTGTETMSDQEFGKMVDLVLKTGEVYVARIPDPEDMSKFKIVGSVTVLYEQKFINNCAIYGHVEDVIVHEKFRHMGIGSKLIKFAQKQAIEKGCFKVVLACSEEVAPFYIQNGFEKRGLNMSFLIKK